MAKSTLQKVCATLQPYDRPKISPLDPISVSVQHSHTRLYLFLVTNNAELNEKQYARQQV